MWHMTGTVWLESGITHVCGCSTQSGEIYCPSFSRFKSENISDLSFCSCFPVEILQYQNQLCSLLMTKWYLLWYLSKVADKTQDGALNQRIFVEVHLVSIEVRVIGVNCLHCSWTMLLVAKNQIYPAMEVCTHIVTFQCLKPKENQLIQ